MAFTPSPISFFRSGYELLTAPARIALVLADSAGGVAVDFAGATALGFSTVASSDTLHIATSNLTPSKIKINDRVHVTAAQGGLPIGSYWVVYSVFAGGANGHDLKLSATRGGAPMDITSNTSVPPTPTPLLLLGPLNEVTVAMAGETPYGDWRQVVAGIMEGLYQKWTNLETTDRPTKLNISKSSGVSGASSVLTYTVRVTLLSQGVDDLAPE